MEKDDRAGELRQLERYAGWNSGDFDTRPGPIGWHFTVEELLRFAIALRTHGKILRQDQRKDRAGNYAQFAEARCGKRYPGLGHGRL